MWLQIYPSPEIISVLVSFIVLGYIVYSYYIFHKRRRKEDGRTREFENIRWKINKNRFEEGDEEIYQIEVTKNEYYVLKNLLRKIELSDSDDIDSGSEDDE